MFTSTAFEAPSKSGTKPSVTCSSPAIGLAGRVIPGHSSAFDRLQDCARAGMRFVLWSGRGQRGYAGLLKTVVSCRVRPCPQGVVGGPALTKNGTDRAPQRRPRETLHLFIQNS